MSMFHPSLPPLPAELVLLILSHLPLASIASLQRVSRDWAYFVQQNKATVYRNAAFLEGYIGKSEMVLEELGDVLKRRSEGKAKAKDRAHERQDADWGGSRSEAPPQGLYSRKVLRGVDNWEALCKRRKLIQHSWSGHAPSRVLTSPRVLPSPLELNTPANNTLENSHRRRVHRIKVDEQVGITLATTEIGGLVVRDLETDEVLWEMPIWYVHSHAHLEYERGYIIFDRTDGTKEVWRRTQDIEAEEMKKQKSTMSSASTSASGGASDDQEQNHFPRPRPDERQLHVANYLHTLAVASAAAAMSPGSDSAQHADSSSSTNTDLNDAAPASTPTTSFKAHKAHFSPYTILALPSPEASRAFRFVYPHLLVAAMDRAYVFDVPKGVLVGRIDGVQRVRRVKVPEMEHENDDQQNASSSTTPAAGMRSPSPEGSDVDAENETQEEHLDAADSDDEVDPTSAQFLGQIRYVEISPRHIFIAGRHVLRIFERASGRCVMNVSSTKERYGAWGWAVVGGDPEVETGGEKAPHGQGKGKGKEKETERERESERVKGKRKDTRYDPNAKAQPSSSSSASAPFTSPPASVDSYDAARTEGREAVRVPLRFTFQSEMSGGGGGGVPLDGHEKMIIDQFIAVHVSRDGKHFVALLSGARLIVVHHFEALLERHRIPPRFRANHHHHGHEHNQSPAVSNAPSSSADGNHPTGVPTHGSKDRKGHKLSRWERLQAHQEQRAAQKARDRDLFMHTMDIRLGSPRVTDSVYLAYEHGRIGVVTSNAVYVVTPTPPPPPVPLSELLQQAKAKLRTGPFPSSSSSPSSALSSLLPSLTYPYPSPPPVSITRLPYFINPSWLGAVTCLMLSDTGLYLNWNPTAPVADPRLPPFRRRTGMVAMGVDGFGGMGGLGGFGGWGGLAGLGGNAGWGGMFPLNAMFGAGAAGDGQDDDDEEDDDDDDEGLYHDAVDEAMEAIDEEGEWVDEEDAWDAVEGEEEWDPQTHTTHLEAGQSAHDTEVGDGVHTGSEHEDEDGQQEHDPLLEHDSLHGQYEAHEDDEGAETGHHEHEEHVQGEMSNGYLAVEVSPQHRHGRASRRHKEQSSDGGDEDRDEAYRREWEAAYAHDLRDMDACEDDWYQALPNGDMFVAPTPRSIEVSEVSTIFAVEFVPEL